MKYTVYFAERFRNDGYIKFNGREYSRLLNIIAIENRLLVYMEHRKSINNEYKIYLLIKQLEGLTMSKHPDILFETMKKRSRI